MRARVRVQRRADSSAAAVRPHCPLSTWKRIDPLRHLRLVPKYGHKLKMKIITFVSVTLHPDDP